MNPNDAMHLADAYRAAARELALAAEPVVVPLARARWQGPAAAACRDEMRRHSTALGRLGADAAQLAAFVLDAAVADPASAAGAGVADAGPREA